MADFQPFAQAVSAKFAELSAGELYETRFDPDSLWDAYLESFPAGTNPIFRERTEHDCSTCRSFVKRLGSVVGVLSIGDGKVDTVWNVEGQEEPYQTVADRMHELVSERALTGLAGPFRTSESSYGQAVNYEPATDSRGELTWTHFAGQVVPAHRASSPDEAKAVVRTAVDVFRRGLDELTGEALDAVEDLIASGSLYKGDEFEKSVKGFHALHRAYHELDFGTARELFVWRNAMHPQSRFRATVIGTLVIDFSAGTELDAAVRMYESKTAPANYKRPKALITPRMVDQAMETIKAEGLESALYRRHATLRDLHVNDVLFVDNETKAHLKGGIEGLLMDAAQTKRPATLLDALEEISAEDFIKGMLPKVTSMDLFVDNDDLSKFMSLTTAEDPDAPALFAWDNPFAWSYDGGVTDSIKQRVKAAGGRVEGAALRISLAWHNGDDLDLHVHAPGGRHISFMDKKGILDVDMNAGGTQNKIDPVENCSWATMPMSGDYRVVVNQYSQRSTENVGFELELESAGQTQVFSYPNMAKRDLDCLEIRIKDGKVDSVKAHNGLLSTTRVQEKWGVTTGQFQKVHALTQSPNQWGEHPTGNAHLFFLLDGMKNPEPVRAVYNEFLRPGMEKHRKVFEVLGDKTKVAPADEQLSGVGFSSTRRDSAKVFVRGPGLHKALQVNF